MMRAYNHQARTDMELVVGGDVFRRLYPGSGVHIRNADGLDARRAPGRVSFISNPRI